MAIHTIQLIFHRFISFGRFYLEEESGRKLALLSDAFRPFVRKIQITHVYHARTDLVAATDTTVFLRPLSSLRDLSFTVLQWASGDSWEPVFRSYLVLHRVRDANSSSFCCRTGGERERARISAKIGERALGDTSLDPFLKKKSPVEGGISRGIECTLIL